MSKSRKRRDLMGRIRESLTVGGVTYAYSYFLEPMIKGYLPDNVKGYMPAVDAYAAAVSATLATFTITNIKDVIVKPVAPKLAAQIDV